MTKRTLTILISSMVISVFTGCIAIDIGSFQGSGRLVTNNFSYVIHNVSGSATTHYVFALIGGVSKTNLVRDAKIDLDKKNPLKANQAFVNITVNYKTTFIVGYFFVLRTCTITADIVEFK